MQTQKSTVGLVLSGGGVRGFAHVGVLKGLERRGWRPDLVAGTSMGGIVAAAYASGMGAQAMEQEALKFTHLPRLARLLDRKVHPNALIGGERLLEYFREKLGGAKFDQLALPLGLLAVDCDTGAEVALRSGDVATAVRATMAFPGVFAPVELDGRLLIDGGASDNLPVRLARDMGADIVVAVNVCPRPECSAFTADDAGLSALLPIPKAAAVAQRGLDIVITSLTDLRLRECPADLLLRPHAPSGVTTFGGFGRIPECIAAGEAAVDEAEDALEAVFDRPQGAVAPEGRPA